MYKRELIYKNINSKRNFLINEVNWNILVTSGKEIKRDSMISVNESREASLLAILLCFLLCLSPLRIRRSKDKRVSWTQQYR